MEHQFIWAKALLGQLVPKAKVESWTDAGDGEQLRMEVSTLDSNVHRFLSFTNNGHRLLVEEENEDGEHVGVLLVVTL